MKTNQEIFNEVDEQLKICGEDLAVINIKRERLQSKFDALFNLHCFIKHK